MTEKKAKAERPSFEKAVQFIAKHDEPQVMETTQIAASTSVELIADLYNKTRKEVAEHVLFARWKAQQEKSK